MRIFSQTKLLLWKNIVLRYRRPGILLLEVVWPVLVVGIIAVMRLAVPPSKHGNCHYQPRAMPSSGAIPFLQTYLCNLDNPCYTSDQKLKMAFETSQQFSAMTENLGPLLGSDEIIDVLSVSNKTSNVYTMIKKAVGNKDLLHGLENVMNVSGYFRDTEKVKSILVNDYQLLTMPEADALMKSRINVGQLTNLTGSPDFQDIACDSGKLAKYVDFPSGADVKQISSSLCNITEDRTTGLANLMIRELNFTTVFNALKLLEEVKESFTDEHNILSYSFEMVAQMFEVVTGSDEVMKLLGTFTGLPDIASFIREIPQFVKGFEDFDSIMSAVKDVINNLEPIMKSFHVDDSPIWRTVKDAAKLGENFMQLADGKWNGTSEEFMHPMKSFLKNIEDMAHDEEGQMFIAFFKFVTKLDLVKAYDEVMYTQGLSESTIKTMLKAMQEMFEEIHLWDSMKTWARINEHTLDVMAILSEKSVDLRHALKSLFDSNDVVKNELKKIFSYGPVITKTILNAFVNNDVLEAIANEEFYSDVCRIALADLQGQVPTDVYDDVRNTLCPGNGDDIETEINKLLGNLKLGAISKVINETVKEFEHLYKGEFFRDDVQLVDMYDHYVRFTNALNSYIYDDYKWYQIFEGVYMDDIDFNERGWEPVTDMLDENFLTTVALGSIQLIGKTFANSPMAKEFSPTIHVMSEMVKLVYETMTDINALTSRDTPLMKVANYATKYAPEIIDGISHMMDTNNDMLFKLLSSEDPLMTFCGDRFLFQMGLPSYVPIRNISSLVCNTNWDTVIANMNQPAKRIELMVQKMAEIMNVDNSMTYDIEKDWVQMQDYSERLFDLVARGQIFGVIDMRTTTVEIFGQLDFSRIDEAMGAANRLITKMMTEDMMMAMEISYRLVSLIEDESSELSITDMFRASMVSFESYLDQMIDSLKNPKGLNSMMGMLSGLPPNVRNMVILISKAYPQFVSAAARNLNNPTMLTTKIISLEASTPDCKTTFVSDYLSLPRDSDVYRFETFLCELNITEFMEELFQSQFSPFLAGNTMLTAASGGSQQLSEIDWKQLQYKYNEFNRLLMVDNGNIAMSPFNMTAIDMAWDQYYRAMDSIAKLDGQKVEALIEDILQIFSISVDKTGDKGLESLLYGSVYLSGQFQKAIMKELSVFDTSSPVILEDHLGSEELRKLTTLLAASPEVNAVGVATIYRLISTPQKAEISMDFGALCHNLTLFSEVFVVSASPVNPADLQSIICQAVESVNVTLLFEQIAHRPMIQTLENAMRVLDEGNVAVMKQGYMDTIENGIKFSELLERIITHPPHIKLTATDDVWMDAQVYAKEWEHLGRQLGQIMDGGLNDSWSQDWESAVAHLAIESLKSLPEASQIFGYVDAFVDLAQGQLDSNSDFFQRYKQYPNTAVVVDLMNKVPEAAQTVLYTVLRQSQKLEAWTHALQSWDSFCATPADAIFSVPPGLKFSVSDFKNEMCGIDGEQLLTELGKAQRTDTLESLITGTVSSIGNATYLENKLTHLFESFMQQSTVTSIDQLANSFNLRLFNESVWEDTSKRINTWLNDTANELMSPDKFSVLIVSTLKDTIEGISPESTEMLNKGLAVGDVVMTELLDILKSSSLDEALKDIPSMKPFIYLLNSVPELFETILYTGTLHPEKIAMKLQSVTTFETFCASHPEEIFSLPPQSSFDAKQWWTTLCSINETMLHQVMDYKAVTHIQEIIEHSLNKSVNITSLVDKTIKMVDSFSRGVPLNERVFDANVWDVVMDNIRSWMDDISTDQLIYSLVERSVGTGVLALLESMPGSSEGLHYIDAVLDIVGDRIENTQVDIMRAFDGFPTIIKLLELVDQSPEIIETVLYTVLTQPEKTAAWSSAMQSWTAFCTTPSSDIMKVPPGSKFNVAAFLSKMCSVDIDQLINELNTYEGTQRINMIMMGNDSVPFNATNTMEKMNKLFGSLEDLISNPMGGGAPELRLLNATLWDRIGMRMGEWLNEAGSNYGSEQTIVEMINQVLKSTLGQMPEAQDVFTKVLGVTGVITDQMIDYLQAGYINSTLGNSPTLQNLVQLAENVPELLEVLMYTSQKHPEKLSSAVNSFMSWDTLCRSSPDNLFSIPPDVTFDIKGWFGKLCALNFTDVENQLGDLKTAKDIESIVSGASGYSGNITSVVARIDKLVDLIGDGPHFNDRFLNETLWSQVMHRLQGWMDSPDFINSNQWMSYVDGIFNAIGDLQKQPEISQALQPLTVVMQVVDNMMDNVLRLQNKTTLEGRDLFAGWQGMENALKFIQTPGVLDTLFASAGNYQKFMPITSEAGLEDFCDPTTDPAKYLTVPSNNAADLQAVKKAFCDINIDRFMDGVNDFVDTQALQQITNGSLAFDWKAFADKVDQFSDLLMKWQKQPPTFNLPPRWMNESYWQNLFDTSLATLPEKMTAKEQIVSIVTQMGPLLDMEGFRQVGMILNKALDILNFNIQSLQGARLTLGTVMEYVPALKELFKAVGVDSSTLRSAALAPIQNTENFAKLFVSNDVQNDFCNTEKWKMAIDFPVTFDTSGLVQTICAGDWQAILRNIEDNFDLTKTLNSLMDNQSHVKDWTNATEKIFDLVDNFESLLKNPPTFNADETLAILTENYNTTNLFKLTSAFSVLNQLFNETGEASGMNDMMEQTSSQLDNVVGMVVGVLDNVLARIKIRDGRLDIAAVFEGVPEVQRIIQGLLDMKPDPLTGLFAVVLRADKITDFMSWSDDPSRLQQLFCDKATFEGVFHIQQDVNVDELLQALCNVDFNQVSQELEKSFVPDMSNATGLDVDEFSHKMEDIISHLTNLTHLEHVLYNGTDLARLIALNSTRLMEMWEEKGFGDVPQHYVVLATQILNSVLNEMGDSADAKTIAVSFKFMSTYLESFNLFLRSIKDQPIHLSTLLNNTQVGDILNPILTNPGSLNALVDMTIDIDKLDQIIEGPSPESALCGDDLFQAFKIPVNEMVTFKDVQTHVCSTNQALLLWQTIMLQANGYLLHQQLEMIENEIDQGRKSINTTAVAVDMEEMVSLMQTIIGQYVDGSRSFSEMIDVDQFKHVLENAQRNIADKLMEASQKWSVEVANIVLPKVLDPRTQIDVAKALNTINLFMNLTIAQLQGMNDGSISVSDFFMKADGLQNMVEAYIRLGSNLAPSLSNNEFDLDKMRHLFKNTTNANALCHNGGIADLISNGPSSPSETVEDFSTVVCSVMGAIMSHDVMEAIGYNEIGDLLMSIWETPKGKPDYTTFVRNVQTFTQLVQELASKSTTISTSLLDRFNLHNTMDSLQNIAQNPQMIFQLLKLLGLAVDQPLSHDEDVVKSLSQMNSFVLMPAVRLFEAMKAKGLTITNMADNPNALLDMMSVLVDFDYHFAAMKEFAVKPRMSTLSRNKDELCMSEYYRDAARGRLAMMNLPASADDILSMVCTQNSSIWLDSFQRMGFTNTQMVVVFDKLLLQADLFDMYVEPFRWTDLMSTLERLSGLISDSGIKSGSSMTDVKSAWTATKDILFEKGFKSLFSYLELVEISSPPMNSDWIVFKQFLRFFSSMMETIDTNVQRVTDKGQYVQLKDALPDSQRLADILTQIVGGQNAAEFLLASVDPIMFFKLSMYDSWGNLCKNNGSITDYFYFPAGTDVDGITKSLCHAVVTQTDAVEELVTLFGAKDMFKQLDMLINTNFNSTDQESIYDRTHSTMMHLIKTLEKAQNIHIDVASLTVYLQPILEVLQGQQMQSFGLCDAMVKYLNKTDEYPYFHDIFSHAFTALNLAMDMVAIIPDMDDLACSLNDEKEISLKNFIHKLADLGVIKNIEKAIQNVMSPPSQMQCSVPMSFSDTVMNVINATTVGHELDTDKMHRCMKDTTVKFREILSSTSRLLDFIKQLVGAIQSPSIQKLLNDPKLISAFNFFMDAIDVNANVIVKFEDLLMNKTSAASYLIDVLAIPRVVTTAIMNSTVNPDLRNFLEQPKDTIRRTFCDPSLLSQTLELPEDSKVNYTDITPIICSNKLTDVVGFLKNVSVSPNSQDKDSMDNELMNVIVNLSNGMADLVSNFEGMVSLFVDLTTKQDIDVFESHIDLIDDIIQGDVMKRFGNSLKEIFDSVKPFFSNDAETQNVIHDVENVIDGIIGIQVIVKGPLSETLEVQDLVLNVTALKHYMLNELKFSPDVTNTILKSVFSTRVLFGLEGKQAYSCNDVFDMILIMNGTGIAPSEISQAFCQLNEKEVTGLVDSLKMELNIGNLIAKYVSYTANSVMASTNMSREELNDMVTKIDKSQVVIQQATEEFKKVKNGSQILDVFSGASADAFTSLDKLAPLMCGQNYEDIFSKGFTGGLVVTSPDSIVKEMTDGIDHNVDDLPNEFCVDIYKSVRRSELGSIIWAYVKPIMRGKILYTPDNEITRAIVQRANDTFRTLAEVNIKASVWAKQAPNLESMTIPLNETEGFRDALENDFIKGLLESTVGVSATNVLTGLDALQSNNFDKEDLTALQALAEVIANYTSCIELDRFVPLATERDLEIEAFRLSKTDTYWAGIVFENVGESDTTTSGRRKRQSDPIIPKHMTYKIRMDVDNVMDTTRLKSGMYTMSAEDNFIEDLRYLRGFIYIQDILDHSIIDFHKNPTLKTPGVKIRQMPFPCHHYDGFIFMLGSYLIPIMMTFVFLAAIGTATHNLTYDRENGQEQTLSVMGMMSGLNFFSWFLTTMALMTVVCAVIAVMLKYTDIFIYSNSVIIFLFLVTFCFSSVNLLYMVSAFFNRTTLAILFVLMIYLISYLPFILVVSLELTMEPWQKILACLASTTAFSFGSHNMGYLEESGTGVQWSNIREEGAKDYSMHWACMMMLIDSAIYLVIGWYVRHVKPGKYGVPKPWYFPILPSFWCGCFDCGAPGNKYLAPKNPEHSKGSLFEAGPPDHEVGIEVNNLSKAYGKNKVLHDLTIDFYEGQISCLLGHNGAAKTTALKLLCGVLEPTTGSVLLNGKRPGSARHSLGVCPQQNSLFDYMSVLEHMEFYSEMKGSRVTIKRMKEIKKLLHDVDLWHVRTVSAGELSYGMKRRLCVALAFVGESRTVVLDEPTSGVDPHARKNIWNLISSNRPGRTILLSTHHLDEADILGDRIAILHKGRLLCAGSPTFLKRQMGGGYKLTISKIANANASDHNGAQSDSGSNSSTISGTDATILNYIRSMSPTASICEAMGTELVIDLPKEESLMNVSLPVLFQDLDKRAKDLGIANYGLTDTKVEDVFLELTVEMDKADKGVDNPALESDSGASTVPIPDGQNRRTNTAEQQQSVDTKKRKTGSGLALSQIVALLVKRFHHYRRNWRMLATCMLLPLIAFMIAIGFSTIRPDEGDQKALVLDPVLYGKDTFTFLKQDAKDSSMAATLTQTFRNSSVGIGTSCMKNSDEGERVFQPSCEKGSAPYNIEKPLYLVGCKTAMQEYHKIAGLKMIVQQEDLPNELYIQNLDDYNIPNYILRTFRDYKDKRFGGWSIEEAFEENDPAEYDPYVWFNSKGYHAMPSFLSAMSNAILRANLPFYNNPEEFGITTINHPIRLGRSPLTLKTLENDAADAGISIMVVIAFSFIPCGFVLYVITEKVHKEKQLQQISGVGTFMYWMVSWFWDMLIYLLAVGVATAIVCIFKTDSFYIRDNIAAFVAILILYGWAMIPYIYLVSRCFKSASTAYLVTFCINLFLAMATVISLLVMQLFREDKVIWECYKICRYVFLIFPQFALGQGLMDMVSATVKYKLFLRFDEDFYDDPFEYDITGYKLIAMAIFGFVFLVLNLLAEKIHARALSVPSNHSETSSELDEDVAKEKDRVCQNQQGDLLRVNDLSKIYRRGWKKFAAVDHINFGIQEGESFGLLGVNGAGKTTTFRMLTGDLGSSGGTVLFNGRKISSHDRHFGQSVGYCPQEGGLDQYLTATETLSFHARLRGFDGEQSKELADQLLSRLGLNPYAKKVVHTYSEGTKRKLALAVAMLGDPPILYLDEPTTGMDAATRRQAWKCIAQANINGQSVVLTSHTMDECDALCGRIAIMVNGQIKCIGSPQHLKNKFGDGYTAVVHSQKDNLGAVSHFFLNHFPGSLIRTKHHSSLEIMIPHSCGILADILAVLQRSQQEDMIEYYSLSQTTLDAVFVSFAQDQTDSFEEGTVTYSSSIEDKSFTPRSSVSSDRPPSYDGHSHNGNGKKDTPYVFSNPQFVLNENESCIPEEEQRPRYVSNITLAAEMAPSPKTDAETGEGTGFNTRF